MSVKITGEVFLQNTEIKARRAGAEAAGDRAERAAATTSASIVRGDKKVDYGTVMRVMGRLSAAGFRSVALVTEVEQGS